MFKILGEVRKKSVREFVRKSGEKAKNYEFLILGQSDEYPEKVEVTPETYSKTEQGDEIELDVRKFVVGGDKPFTKFVEIPSEE